MFYPNFCFTASKSGVKQIPALSYLKTVLTSYETVGHFIFQNGRVTNHDIMLFPCPNSYKGSVRVALALTETFPCYIRTYYEKMQKKTVLNQIILWSLSALVWMLPFIMFKSC